MASVLVVDDEPLIRRSVRRILERAGHEVRESPNGADALRLLDRTTPDILITDLHMPGCDGFELTRALRKSGGPQPRIIVLSGDDDETVRAQASAIGATALTKPFTSEELLAAVAKASASPARVIRILVVDDQPDVCLAFRYMLEADDFLVADASNGKQALAHLEKEPVDLLLTDLFMPEMDGLTLLRELQRGRAPLPRTIAFTGSSAIDRKESLEEAHRLGANAVLEKPISREVLLHTIHSLIDGKLPESTG